MKILLENQPLEEIWALRAAAVNGHAEAVAISLKHGADIEAKFECAFKVAFQVSE